MIWRLLSLIPYSPHPVRYQICPVLVSDEMPDEIFQPNAKKASLHAGLPHQSMEVEHIHQIAFVYQNQGDPVFPWIFQQSKDA